MHKLTLKEPLKVKLPILERLILLKAKYAIINPDQCMGNFLWVVGNDLYQDNKRRLAEAFQKVSGDWHTKHNGCNWDLPIEILIKRKGK